MRARSRVRGGVGLALLLILFISPSAGRAQPASGAVLADLVVTTTSQQLVAAGPRLGIICWNQGTSPNAIRIGFGATPTATSGFFLPWGSGFSDNGSYAISVIRDSNATGNPTLSCSTVAR